MKIFNHPCYIADIVLTTNPRNDGFSYFRGSDGSLLEYDRKGQAEPENPPDEGNIVLYQ